MGEYIAFRRHGNVYAVNTAGGKPTQRASGGVFDFAFGRGGALYVTRPNGHSCDLYTATGTRPLVRWSDIRDQVDRGEGLCDISSHPYGGVLFEADNFTLGSVATWLLDPRTQLVRGVGFGYQPAISRTGRRIVTVVRYYAPFGGGYMSLVMYEPGHPQAYRHVVPLPTRSYAPEYGSPSLSRDSRRLAASRSSCGAITCVEELVVGPLGGRLRTTGFSVKTIRGTAWATDGKSLFVGAARTEGERFDLYQVPLNGDQPQIVLRGIGAWTIRGASMS